MLEGRPPAASQSGSFKACAEWRPPVTGQANLRGFQVNHRRHLGGVLKEKLQHPATKERALNHIEDPSKT